MAEIIIRVITKRRVEFDDDDDNDNENNNNTSEQKHTKKRNSG